jgi:hypothetical protein
MGVLSRYCLFSVLPQSFDAKAGGNPPKAKQATKLRPTTGYFLGEKSKNAKCNSLLPNIWIC